MKIAIVEIEIINHYLSVRALYNIISQKYQNAHIDIITLHEFASFFQDIVKHNHLVLLEQPNTLSKLNLNKYSHIFFNSSFYYSELYYNLLLNNHSSNIYVGVHNDIIFHSANFIELLYKSYQTTMMHSNNKINNFKDWLYAIRNYYPHYTNILIHRNRIIKWISKNDNAKIMVFGNKTYLYAREWLNFKEEKILKLPFCIYENKNTTYENYKINKKIHIVIPGRINQLLRDYISLLKILIENPQLSKEFKFYFLGILDTKNVEHYIKEAINVGYEIFIPQKYLSDKDFQEIVSSCDFILGNNIKNKVKYHLYAETGIIYNMIRFGKPGILIDFLIDDTIKPMSIPFENYQQLINIFNGMVNDKIMIDKLKENALKISKQFAADKIFLEL
jgi:hypothetical protein